MDWRSRYVLSWKLFIPLGTDLCVVALEEALSKIRPEVLNTDQGAQFIGEVFTEPLKEQWVRVSMDGKGRNLDNIFSERL